MNAWPIYLVIALVGFFALTYADHRGYDRGYDRGYSDAKHRYCTHGESSITAIKINGKFVQSKPTRTGC